MKHLILSREYPPAPYPPGGIGTYVRHISRLLAESGEEVHVIAQRWSGASAPVEELCGGRLVVHRVAAEDPPEPDVPAAAAAEERQGLLDSAFPERWFSWRAALLAEKLVEAEGIDVVEAQEWEAPLYDFQLRRALGRGPRRAPPCIIHLHSPTEFIFLHNGWDLGRPEYLPMKRLEDYTIAAADARLAPSRFLARQCEERYGLEKGSIAVLPHPVGDTPVVERAEATWSAGTVLYVGRLEPRKGVVEWVQAAVPVLAEHPEVLLGFVGADLEYVRGTSVKEHALGQIPGGLRDRFAFHGPCDRNGVRRFLAEAWAAVVPSRWENLPYTCIEAMASGLPVLASRRGGMADLVEDGRTGWLAPEGEALVDGLQDAFRRALGTSPARRAEMGRAAALAIRRLCDDATVVRKHIDFRASVAARGRRSSVQVRARSSLPSATTESVSRPGAATPAGGIAVVIVGVQPEEALHRCIDAVLGQTLPPGVVAVVGGPDGSNAAAPAAVSRLRQAGLRVVEARSDSLAAARNAGIEAVQAEVGTPEGWVFVDPHWRLRPGWLEACRHTLRECPEVGLVSSWQRRSREGVVVRPSPALPYQWIVDDAAPCSAFRGEALREAGGFRRSLDAAYQGWDLASAVLAAGWAGVTYPAVLSEVDDAEDTLPPGQDLRMRRAILERFPELVERHATELLLLQACGVGSASARPALAAPPRRRRARAPAPREFLRLPLAQQAGYLARALRHPARASWWAMRHLGRFVVEALASGRRAGYR